MGLQDYAALFASEHLDGRDILDLNNDDLRSVGVKVLHDRKLILRACRQLQQAEERETEA